MIGEFEFIDYSNFKHLNVFLVELKYRTPHFHHHIEMGLVLRGRLNIKKGESDFLLEENDVFILNPREPHELFAKDNHVLILIMQVSNKMFTSYYQEIKNVYFTELNLGNVLPQKKHQHLLLLMKELAFSYFKQEPFYELQCMISINQILLFLMMNAPYKTISDSEQAVIHRHISRLNRIINYVEENYSRKLLLREIAEKERLSLTYLSNFIKMHLGMPFQEYLNRTRLDHAVHLIEDTELSIHEICMESGFSDVRYLNKFFTLRYGYPPKEHRRRYPSAYKTKKQPCASSQHFIPFEDAVLLLEVT